MESYRDGEHLFVYRISSSIFLWEVLGVKNEKKHQKILKKVSFLKATVSVLGPLKELYRGSVGVVPPSDYPESSWNVFWLVLALLGSDLDEMNRTDVPHLPI